MRDCSSIDPLVTPYVDGHIADGDRHSIEQHLGACAACRARVGRERAVRDLIEVRKPGLCAEFAPLALRARCSTAAADALRRTAPARVNVWRARLTPVALAATLVIIVGGAFLYPLTERSARVMAAELTLDHLKCSLFNAALGTRHSVESVEQALASSFGWPARLPDGPEQAGLELVGERTCLYGEGRVAHVMYRHEGRTVSVFMLPDDARTEEVIEVLGHRAAIWSVGRRTFVLLGREPHDELQRMASFVRAGLR
jgi:anti-sigma factor RsiW